MNFLLVNLFQFTRILYVVCGLSYSWMLWQYFRLHSVYFCSTKSQQSRLNAFHTLMSRPYRVIEWETANNSPWAALGFQWFILFIFNTWKPQAPNLVLCRLPGKNLILKHSLQMFNRVEVWTLGRSSQMLNVSLLYLFHNSLMCVWGDSPVITLKYVQVSTVG